MEIREINANEFVKKLTEILSSNDEILGIGQIGDINAPLIPGKSDIDLFVLCSNIPSIENRNSMYLKLESFLIKLILKFQKVEYGDMEMFFLLKELM